MCLHGDENTDLRLRRPRANGHIAEEPRSLPQRREATLLHDASPFQYDDGVAILQRGQAVGDGNDSGPVLVAEFLDLGLHALF